MNNVIQIRRREFNRRRFNKLAAATGLSLFVPASSSSYAWDRKNSPNEKSPAQLVTADTKKAIDRALNYLKQRQVKSGRNRGAFSNKGLGSGRSHHLSWWTGVYVRRQCSRIWQVRQSH